MKHLKSVSAARTIGATQVPDILDRIFGFVLELVQIKGKSTPEV